MLRLLHTGDLHLCSSFSAFSPRVAAKRRERQFEALEQLLADAVRAGAQLLLFAGDCFDSTTPDPGSVQRFFNLLGKQPVPSVIAPGNHDYYLRGGFYDTVTIPSNVHLFRSSELSSVDFPELGATVYGYAFTGEMMQTPNLGRAIERAHDRINVLLAHADLISPISKYAPISAGQLERTGFLYAALGHVHKPTKPRRCGHTIAAYCGFFAGRGFDELGPGHANMVVIQERNIVVEPMVTVADRFEERELDCTGAATTEDVRSRVAAYLAAEKLPPETALRLHLTGQVVTGCRADKASIARLGKDYALFEVADETLPIYNAEYLEQDPGIKGAFYRAMVAHLQSDNEQERATAAEALRLGFAALSGREV